MDGFLEVKTSLFPASRHSGPTPHPPTQTRTANPIHQTPNLKLVLLRGRRLEPEALKFIRLRPKTASHGQDLDEAFLV